MTMPRLEEELDPIHAAAQCWTLILADQLNPHGADPEELAERLHSLIYTEQLDDGRTLVDPTLIIRGGAIVMRALAERWLNASGIPTEQAAFWLKLAIDQALTRPGAPRTNATGDH